MRANRQGWRNSDQPGSFRRRQHGQYHGSVADIFRNLDQRVRDRLMLCRQTLKPCADVMKLVNFVQNRFKNHCSRRSLVEKPKGLENFR